jgi:hypothetical protein
MGKWLRDIDWLPLAITALIIVLGFNVLSWLGFPASGASGGQSGHTPGGESHGSEAWVAFFTFTLTGSTLLLWWATADLAGEARDSAKKLIKIESPYVTGGGDFEDKTGKELFRLDVENHSKTPAFMTAYDVQFATLRELRQEFPTAREVRPLRRHIDGLSPTGARKKIYTQIPMPPGADAVYGAIYYQDPILGIEHFSRFILRIAPTREVAPEF